MKNLTKQANTDFYLYPPIGRDDWRYVYQTAVVRTLQVRMLSKAAILDMVNAPNLAEALDCLSATDYSAAAGRTDFSQIEEVLVSRQKGLGHLFCDLMIDKRRVELLQARDDFANLKLALRRVLTERPVGTDYLTTGNVPAESFSNILEQGDYSRLPGYLQDAAEQAVLGYYENKDIRQIDYIIDSAQSAWQLQTARKLGSAFLAGLCRIQIDLTNIRTILRLKWNASDRRKVLLEGGFVNPRDLINAADLGYEAIPAVFGQGPYYEIASSGISYLTENDSFLRLEQLCDDYLAGFLKLTDTITAGPQPIIAYLLAKEDEIRKVRLILTAKEHQLETNLILDRIGG